MATGAQARLHEHRAAAVYTREKHPKLHFENLVFDISQHAFHARSKHPGAEAIDRQLPLAGASIDHLGLQRWR